jgi:hypothetical protein
MVSPTEVSLWKAASYRLSLGMKQRWTTETAAQKRYNLDNGRDLWPERDSNPREAPLWSNGVKDPKRSFPDDESGA